MPNKSRTDPLKVSELASGIVMSLLQGDVDVLMTTALNTQTIGADLRTRQAQFNFGDIQSLAIRDMAL
jgi:hypothetical protein